MKLIVVTDRNWMQQELASNSRVETLRSYGLEVPQHAQEDAWWIPQSPATRFQLSGMQWRLQSPGPRWMEQLPLKYAGRDIRVLTFGELKSLPREHTAHIKFAEAKSEVLQASVQSVGEAVDLLLAANTPDDSLLQLSEALDLGDEWRFWIRNNQVVASSRYLHRVGGAEVTYYDQEEARGEGYEQAHHLASEVAARIDAPDGYVLDVALTVSGQALVIEANPAWCAAWYGSEIDGVVDAVLAANEPNERWAWHPDASLLRRYSRQRALPWAQAKRL